MCQKPQAVGCYVCHLNGRSVFAMRLAHKGMTLKEFLAYRRTKVYFVVDVFRRDLRQ